MKCHIKRWRFFWSDECSFERALWFSGNNVTRIFLISPHGIWWHLVVECATLQHKIHGHHCIIDIFIHAECRHSIWVCLSMRSYRRNEEEQRRVLRPRPSSRSSATALGKVLWSGYYMWKKKNSHACVKRVLGGFDLKWFWVYFVSREIKIGKATMKLPFFVWNQRNKPEVSAQPSVSFKV